MRKHFFCVLVLSLSISAAVEGQSFYIVIASFTEEARARQFSTSVSHVFEDASFRFDAQRKLFHVFTMQTGVREDAEDHRKHLQQVAGFRDAWIFAEGKEYSAVHDGGEKDSVGVAKLELYNGTTVLLSSADNSYMSISQKHSDVQQTSSGQSFSFIAKTRNGHVIPARVILFDNHGNHVSTLKTNKVAGLNGKNGKERLTLVCDAPGYSTETKIINLSQPRPNEHMKLSDKGVWEVVFSLSRVKPDEVQFVYRGLFHKDASVVESFGKKNIEVLLALLKENPAWRVVINSHTNPQPKRQIALASSEDVFDVSLARFKEGTDKQLTKERAEILQHYLVAAGIDKERITAMGWGSLAKVADPAKGDAWLNDRIEVELLMD